MTNRKTPLRRLAEVAFFVVVVVTLCYLALWWSMSDQARAIGAVLECAPSRYQPRPVECIERDFEACLAEGRYSREECMEIATR